MPLHVKSPTQAGLFEFFRKNCKTCPENISIFPFPKDKNIRADGVGNQ